MRVINLDKNAQAEVVVAESLSESFSQTPVMHKSYHELADTPVVEKDALAQLHSNLEMLNDLQTRLAFVMREVRYLLKA